MALLQKGTRGFGRERVSGLNRVPKPPANQIDIFDQRSDINMPIGAIQLE
jgi:hypothetical protein